MSLGSQKWLKYVLTISLAVTPLVGTNAYAGKCEDATKRFVQACRGANDAVNADQATQMDYYVGTQNNVRNNIDGTADVFSNTGNNRNAAAGKCSELQDKCDTECKSEGKSKIDQCKQAIK